MAFFYKCLSCQKTSPAFAEGIAVCSLCGSDRLEASPGVEPARLERGSYYEIDLATGKPGTAG